ncbi:GGDEF domain-containing protein [Dactylosporangium sp. CA-152071]|uniref:GGDEF domain-containing protein n=1 Tax=Dactylosporangium sp. CA-152071 TaxID=3239933 RepID=UPI003D8FD589
MSTLAMAAASVGSALALGAAVGGAGAFILGRRSMRGQLEKLRHERISAQVAAKTDWLTGLWNRAGLMQELKDRVGGIVSESSFGVLLIDLDGFKEVNDSLDHDAGDEVLMVVAERLQRIADGAVDGYVARLGGDEFVLVVESPAPAFTRLLAREVVKAVAEPINIDLWTVQVGASVGMVQGLIGSDVRELLRSADVAMYEVKAGLGENGVAEFDPVREVADVWAGHRPKTRLRELARQAREGLGVRAGRSGVIA